MQVTSLVPLLRANDASPPFPYPTLPVWMGENAINQGLTLSGTPLMPVESLIRGKSHLVNHRGGPTLRFP